MTSYGFVIDTDKCIECGLCLTACKDEYVGNSYPPYSAAQPDTQYGYYRTTPGWIPDDGAAKGQAWVKPGQNWINIVEMNRGTYPHAHTRYVPKPCMQCEDPPCMKPATGGAVYKRDDGLVIIDPEKSVGQEQIVEACPYGVIFWNEDLRIPQKCTFCAHLIDQGKNPKCADACPVTAIQFGDLSDPKSAVSQLVAGGAVQLNPEFGARPKVYYVGLPTPFVSGKVVDAVSKAYLEGAKVTLTDSGGRSVTTTTDNYGDFEFNDLASSGSYQLKIELASYNAKTMPVPKTDTDLGEIPL
jgi:tetrathionate reductase subunit B